MKFRIYIDGHCWLNRPLAFRTAAKFRVPTPKGHTL